MKLVSPLFIKELATLSRRKSYFVARGLVLAALLATVTLAWSSRHWSEYPAFVDTSFIGSFVFHMFVLVQFLAVVILVPAFTAPVVAAEKDRNTLGLLLMSNLSPANILLDKLLSRLLVMVLLIVSALPIFLALLAFGGVEFANVLTAYADILATILFCAGIGLLWSTLLDKPYTALIATYATLLVYTFGLFLISENCDWEPDWMVPTLGFAGNIADRRAFWILSMVVFLLCWSVSLRLLPHMAEPQKRRFVKKIFRRLDAFFHRINYTGVLLWEERRGPAKNALFWKEFHQRFVASRRFLFRAAYSLFIVTALAFIFGRNSDIPFGIILLGGTILVCLIASVAAAAAFAAEREKRSLDVLLSTPVTARSLVLSKFAGTLRLTVPILVVMAVWAPFGDYIADAQASLLGVVLVAVAHVPFLTAAGLYAGTKCRRTATAVAVALGFYCAWILFPWIAEFLDDIGFVNINHNTVETLGSVSPVYMVGLLAFDAGDFLWWPSVFVVAGWVFLLRRLVRRFDRILGRQ